jgi:hypothetical protein
VSLVPEVLIKEIPSAIKDMNASASLLQLAMYVLTIVLCAGLDSVSFSIRETQAEES